MAHDQKSGGELLRTLDAYIACGGSPLDTAQRLHAHRNTVLYRLDRIAELLGVDVRHPEQRLLFHLALRAGEVLGELQPGALSQADGGAPAGAAGPGAPPAPAGAGRGRRARRGRRRAPAGGRGRRPARPAPARRRARPPGAAWPWPTGGPAGSEASRGAEPAAGRRGDESAPGTGNRAPGPIDTAQTPC